MPAEIQDLSLKTVAVTVSFLCQTVFTPAGVDPQGVWLKGIFNYIFNVANADLMGEALLINVSS
jgi:hypothetical protein